jgi:hypothetical protein
MVLYDSNDKGLRWKQQLDGVSVEGSREVVHCMIKSSLVFEDHGLRTFLDRTSFPGDHDDTVPFQFRALAQNICIG